MVEQREQIDFEKIFKNFGNLSSFYETETKIEVHEDWPDTLGTGFLSMINLRQGFFLGIEKYSLKQDLAIHFTNEFSPFKFYFSLTGGEKIIVNENAEETFIEDSYASNTGIVYYSSARHTTGILPARLPIQSVCLYIAPYLLYTLMDEHYHLPNITYDMAKSMTTKPYYVTFFIIPILNNICRQILNCTYSGTMRQIYLESKALELLALTLEQLSSSADKKPPILCSTEKKQIQYARRLMEEGNTANLSTTLIAKKVGMTHAKLNACFRDMYGVTAFTYFREMRLKKAKLLLSNGDMNITEVAYEVGYSSLSHFSKAFRDLHGSTPSDYLRKIQGKEAVHNNHFC